MPEELTRYRIFIGSPGDVEEEREEFHATIERYTKSHADAKRVLFHSIGFEDIQAPYGQKQDAINRIIEQCDYAIFVLHRRWGRPTANGFSSATEEEWTLTDRLHRQLQIRDIAFFFKEIEAVLLRDPSEQIKQVLAFKDQVGKSHIYKHFRTPADFAIKLEKRLQKWLDDHDRSLMTASPDKNMLAFDTGHSFAHATSGAPPFAPSFGFWMSQAREVFSAAQDYDGALFCTARAILSARSDDEWLNAKELSGFALLHLGRLSESISAFTEIVGSGRLGRSGELSFARALNGKAAALALLGQQKEAIGIYQTVWNRFKVAPQFALREQAAQALLEKGGALGQIDEVPGEIDAYGDLLAWLDGLSEPGLAEHTAKALMNKAAALRRIQRYDQAIAAYDALVRRYGTELIAFGIYVAEALASKVDVLEALGQLEPAIATCNSLVERLGTTPDLRLSDKVAGALFRKGEILGRLGRSSEALSAWTTIVARFERAPDPALRRWVAKALLSRGNILLKIGRPDESASSFDTVIAGFQTEVELFFRKIVSEALLRKGRALRQLNGSDEALPIYDRLVKDFGAESDLGIRQLVADAFMEKAAVAAMFGQREAELAAYQGLIARFDTAPESALRDVVAEARSRMNELGD